MVTLSTTTSLTLPGTQAVPQNTPARLRPTPVRVAVNPAAAVPPADGTLLPRGSLLDRLA